MVDVVFGVRGGFLPADHAYALHRAVAAVLGWLDDEPAAGVHPLRGASAVAEGLVLGRRARLVLRVPAARAEACAQLEGAQLDAGGLLALGSAVARPLAPYPVLYSRFVATGAQDEAGFQADARRLAAEAGLDCELIVGRRREGFDGRVTVAGHSLMLHGLSDEDSLAAQYAGIGQGRKLGRGLFVPHKSIAPVGG